MLANMGVGTRREVKALLKKRLVTVNGEVIKDGSKHIDPDTDHVELNGERIAYQKYIYLMLHKPAGFLSATTDRHSKTVIDLLDDKHIHFDPFPVGRLDKDTEGLLLLTNDGQLAHQLLSPTKNVEKTYFAHIDGEVTDQDIARFAAGVELDDGYKTKPAKLEILKSGDESEIELTITEGKYHQVKRMFQATGKKVTYLKRLRMGEIMLDHALPRGKYRELTDQELAYCEKMKKS